MRYQAALRPDSTASPDSKSLPPSAPRLPLAIRFLLPFLALIPPLILGKHRPKLGDGPAVYALEGSVAITGALLQLAARQAGHHRHRTRLESCDMGSGQFLLTSFEELV